MLNPADEAFVSHLPVSLISPVEARYQQEPRRRTEGRGAFVARPTCTRDVATILRACTSARVGIVPFGGGTGLVLGQVMPEGPAPLILSLERMNCVRASYPTEGVLVAEGGAILQDIQRAAEDSGWVFPLKLASQGSAQIGGLLSTNAGGVHVLRYGNARELCLGIEAVLPDGSIFHGLKRLRKDNTGYDLRHLLVGAEGSLGVITAASLKLSSPAASVGTALLQVPSPDAALRLLALAQARMAGCVSAFELIGGQGLLFLDECLPQIRQPWAARPDWSVLLEVELPAGIVAETALAELFAAAGDLFSDGIIAQNLAQAQSFWQLREALPEANRKIGAIVSHDISLPLSEIASFLTDAASVIRTFGPLRINCFGHLGDGNLHFNLFPPMGESRAAYIDRSEDIQRQVHDLVMRLGGSFSAEHGIGRLKVAELERYGDPAKLAAMRAIKAALDPLGIMNPGAVLRP